MATTIGSNNFMEVQPDWVGTAKAQENHLHYVINYSVHIYMLHEYEQLTKLLCSK